MSKDFSKEEFDIIIQAGQSNSEGCGIGDVTSQFVPGDSIWNLNNDLTISMAQERMFENEIIGNFSLSFAAEYIKKGKLNQGRKVLILQTAIGGTGFLDNHWGMTDDLYLKMIEMIETALALNPKNKLVAFLWHQGETDASLNSTHEIYFNNLHTLVNSVRTKYNCENLPFIAADFVSQWKMENIAICEPVIAATKDVCTKLGNAGFVETSDLQSNDQKVGNGDVIHFCREDLNVLGVRYFNIYCEIE